MSGVGLGTSRHDVVEHLEHSADRVLEGGRSLFPLGLLKLSPHFRVEDVAEFLSEELFDQFKDLLRLLVEFLFFLDLMSGLKLGLGFRLLLLLVPHLELELAGDLAVTDVATEVRKLVGGQVIDHRLFELAHIEGLGHCLILCHS